MDLYKELAAIRCFTRSDLLRLTGSENAAAWYISRYLKKGYIERVRRDLYAVISLETGQPIPNRFQIASRMAEDACVSHHSAFEYYGVANQVFYEVYVATEKRLRPFSYDGVDYRCVAGHGSSSVVESTNDVRVTSLERTVIDSIAAFEKIGGLEELVRCLLLIPSLDEDKLLETLAIYGQGQLYQKTGYVLESLNDSFALPESFFITCEKNSSNSKTYLASNHKDFILQKRWKLFAPDNLKSLVDKGVNDHGAI